MSRQLFEARIEELKISKGKNNGMITKDEYKQIVVSLKKMHSDKDYIPNQIEKNWKKRFQIMSFEKDGRQIETLVKPDKTKTGKRLRFITVEGTVYILGTVTS